MRTKAAAPNRWFSGRRVADRVPHDDPADQGTAFGLEMTLDPNWTQPAQPAAPTPSGWVQRLAARRRPA